MGCWKSNRGSDVCKANALWTILSLQSLKLHDFSGKKNKVYAIVSLFSSEECKDEVLRKDLNITQKIKMVLKLFKIFKNVMLHVMTSKQLEVINYTVAQISLSALVFSKQVKSSNTLHPLFFSCKGIVEI